MLKGYQNRLLSMLLVFDAFCKEHKLVYFLAGGSTLGAVRHDGFIPWDDDIDLAMPREDFEKLEKLMDQQSNRLEEYFYSPVFGQLIPEAPIGHLYDFPKGNYDIKTAPKLDIHPLDGAAKTSFGKRILQLNVIINHLSVYRHPTKNKGKIAHLISKGMVKVFPKWLWDFFAVLSKKILMFRKFKNSNQIISLHGLAGYDREKMPKDYILPVKEHMFEGYSLPVPAKCEAYLTALYGDYMKMPPEKDRHPKHDGYEAFMKGISGEAK